MAVAAITETKQYLSFKLDGEVFALDVAQVREVLDHMNITKVPRAPDFMRGVINVRGSVVPVVDMRLKFGMSATEKTVYTCIIVMEISLNDDKTIVGAMVDSVQEVLDLDPEQIEPAPKIGTRWNTDFIKGIGKHTDDFIIILDIDRVFSQEDISLVSDNAAAGTEHQDAETS